jgi:hypothetical protein
MVEMCGLAQNLGSDASTIIRSQAKRGWKKRGLRRPLAEIKSAEAKRISQSGETLSIGNMVLLQR